MDKNKKPLKPGQLVTIGNHIYRVVKDKNLFNNWRHICSKCAFCWNVSVCHTICERFCFKEYYSKDRPMLKNCYFKLVK